MFCIHETHFIPVICVRGAVEWVPLKKRKPNDDDKRGKEREKRRLVYRATLALANWFKVSEREKRLSDNEKCKIYEWNVRIAQHQSSARRMRPD